MVRVSDMCVGHDSDTWFTVAVSAADSTGTETDQSQRLGSVSGDTRKMLHRKLKNSEKITTNLKKNVDVYIHVSHVQNISPSTLNIKRKYKHIKIHAQYSKLHKLHS